MYIGVTKVCGYEYKAKLRQQSIKFIIFSELTKFHFCKQFVREQFSREIKYTNIIFTCCFSVWLQWIKTKEAGQLQTKKFRDVSGGKFPNTIATYQMPFAAHI